MQLQLSLMLDDTNISCNSMNDHQRITPWLTKSALNLNRNQHLKATIDINSDK